MVAFMNQEKLTTPEAAKYSSMSTSSLYRKAERGEIAHEKYMGRLFFTKEDLDSYIEKNTKKITLC
jgi:excisionase family DNA binding protein